MVPTRKRKVEQLAVLALGGVFVLVLGGSLRSLGLLGSTPSTPSLGGAMAEAPTMITPLPETVRSASAEVRLESFKQAETTALHGLGPHDAPVLYTADELRDPLVPLFPEESKPAAVKPPAAEASPQIPEPPKMVLEGVIWGGQIPQAIIDGEVYTVGDLVRGARIVSISRDSIAVELQGATFQLTLSDMRERSRSSSSGFSYPTPMPTRQFRLPGGEP